MPKWVVMVAMMEILIGDKDWVYRDFFRPWRET